MADGAIWEVHLKTLNELAGLALSLAFSYIWYVLIVYPLYPFFLGLQIANGLLVAYRAGIEACSPIVLLRLMSSCRNLKKRSLFILKALLIRFS